MKKVNIFKLEDRVLFDAAGVADAVDAANQAASAEASAAQEQAQDSKEALKNAPPENPADAAANAQAQQNHSNPGEAADLDAAANKIVEGEIVPGQAPEQADAPADGADVDASAADTDGEAPDADHAAAESQGGDAGDSGDAGDAGDINDVPLGDIDDFINGGHDSDADHDGDAEHNAEQDSADADKPAPALDAVPAAANADAPGRELVIINSSVKDAQAIIDALGDNTDVLFLENGTDALDAINEYLDANGIKYDAIHIVSHGNAGYFVLNGEIIDAQSVANDPASWANIGKHLSDNGDIMIYGCNVAGNLDGQMLVSQIASLTGADVAASVDSTGVNGNWDLEYSIGVIDHQFINVQDYSYTLASRTLTIDGTGTGTDHYSDFKSAYDFAITLKDTDVIFNFTVNLTGDKAIGNDYTFSSDYIFRSTAGVDITFSGTITMAGDQSFSGFGDLIFSKDVSLLHDTTLRVDGSIDHVQIGGNLNLANNAYLNSSATTVDLNKIVVAENAVAGVRLGAAVDNFTFEVGGNSSLDLTVGNSTLKGMEVGGSLTQSKNWFNYQFDSDVNFDMLDINGAVAINSTGNIGILGGTLVTDGELKLTAGTIDFHDQAIGLYGRNTEATLTTSGSVINVSSVYVSGTEATTLNLGADRAVDYHIMMQQGSSLTLIAGDVELGNRMLLFNGASLAIQSSGNVTGGGILADFTTNGLDTTLDLSKVTTKVDGLADIGVNGTGTLTLILGEANKLEDTQNITLSGQAGLNLTTPGAVSGNNITLANGTSLKLVAESFDFGNLMTGGSWDTGSDQAVTVLNLSEVGLISGLASQLEVQGNGTLKLELGSHSQTLDVKVGNNSGLSLNGENILLGAITVGSKGTLTYSGSVIVDAANPGSYQIADDATLNLGHLTVNNGTDYKITAGTYGGLTLNGTSYIFGQDREVTVNGTIQVLSGDLLVEALKGEVTIDASKAGAGQTVTYADVYTGALMGGSYQNLVLKGANDYNIAEGVTVGVVGTLTNLSTGLFFIAQNGSLYTNHVVDTANARYVLAAGGSWTFGVIEYDLTGKPVVVQADNTETRPLRGVREEILGAISNYGTISIQASGYTFAKVENGSDGTIWVDDYLANVLGKNDYENQIRFADLTNSGTIYFGALSRIDQMAGSWTNSGSLTVVGFENFGFEADTSLKIVNTGSISIRGTDSITVNYEVNLKTAVAGGILIENTGLIHASNNAILRVNAGGSDVGAGIQVGSGGKLVIGNANITKDVIISAPGNYYLEYNGCTIDGSILVSGDDANLTITAYNSTFRGTIGIGRGNSVINIKGDGITFTGDVTNAYGWYSTGDYLFNDDSDYIIGYVPGSHNLTQTSANMLYYKGTINVEGIKADGSDGQITFLGQVVSVSEFNITGGNITFGNNMSGMVAVAGGTFNIYSGSVSFNSNVYVSATYNSQRDTELNITGGTVRFNKDLFNWVRSYRGDWYTVKVGDKDVVYGYGDVVSISKVDANGNITYYADLVTDYNPTTSVNIKGGTVNFASNSTLRNYGTFGQASVTIENATVTLGNVRNISYFSYNPYNVKWDSRNNITWRADWISEYRDATGGAVNGFTGRIDSIYGADPIRHAHFTIGSNVIVNGDVANYGDSIYYPYNPTPVTDRAAQFKILGDHNVFNGNIDNRSLDSFLLINSTGSIFTTISNSNQAELWISGVHSLGTITNASKVSITDAGTSTLTLVNQASGETIISGSGNTGFNFDSITIEGGSIVIASEFGEDGINADITIQKNGTLQISAKNYLNSTINNQGTIDLDAVDMKVAGQIDNYGNFNVNQYAEFTGVITNHEGGNFKVGAANVLFDGNMTNQGILTVAKMAIFRNLVNDTTGSIIFSASSSGSVGADGTIFINLTNRGAITVNVNSVLFTDGLTNSGTGTITVSSGATGTRFQNMVDKSGAILFVNSGTLNFRADAGANEYIDLKNTSTGVISVEANINFANMENDGQLTISGTRTNGTSNTINFYGTLVNNGTIGGSGAVNIYYIASGTGTFNMTSSRSVVAYLYDPSKPVTGLPSGNTSAFIDSDGYWRIGGERFMDAYANRPVYSEALGAWVRVDGTVIAGTEGMSRYADVNIQSGSWYIGKFDTGISVPSKPAVEVTISSAGNWVVGGTDTGVSATKAGQVVFGGQVYGLNILGAGTMSLDGKLTVKGDFHSENSLSIHKDAQLEIAGKFQDTAGAGFAIASGGRLVFSMANYSADHAEVNGKIDNLGTISISDYRTVTFKGSTTGSSGAVSASNAYVTYDSDAEQVVYRGSYDKLTLSGSSVKVLGSEVVTNDLYNNSGVTLAQSTLTVNRHAEGTGDYTVGTEGMIVFNNTAGQGSSIDGIITVEKGAYGVNFNGGTGNSQIRVNKLVNNSLEVPDSSLWIGVKAANTAFGEVTNNGTFRVLDNLVTLGHFTQDAGEGSKLIFAIGDSTFNIDGSTNSIEGKGGEIDIESGTIQISAVIASNNTAIVVRDGAVLQLYAAGLTLPQVTVDQGGTLNVSRNAWIGRDGDKTNGLTLNGTLNVEGEGGTSAILTVYAYHTNGEAASTAKIYIGNGGTLTFEHLDDTSYGIVYGAIEIANGDLTGYEEGQPLPARLTGAQIENWIVIDSGTDNHTSDYKPGSKFLVIGNGVMLTVDTDVAALRAQNGGSLTMAEGSITVDGEVTVDGTSGSSIYVVKGSDVMFNGWVTATGDNVIYGDGNITFNGKITTSITDPATGTVYAGTIKMGDESVVTYSGQAGEAGSVMELFSGVYGTLVVNREAVINGKVTVNTSLSGSGKVTFAGETFGNGTVKATEDGKKINVVYENAATTVYSGDYGDLTIKGDHTVTGADEKNTVTITVEGAITITGADGTGAATLKLDNANLKIGNGAINNTDYARIEASNNSTVTYEYSGNRDRAIYSGIYRTLEINSSGLGSQVVDALTVQTALTGQGGLVIQGSIAGTGSVMGGKIDVTYGEAITEGFLGGNYHNLILNGSGTKTFSSNITVSGRFQAAGSTLLGNGNLTFNGEIVGTATFGTAEQAYLGHVVYGLSEGTRAQTVFGGNYTTLEFIGTEKSIAENLTVGVLTTGADIAIKSGAVATVDSLVIAEGGSSLIRIGSGATLNVTLNGNAALQPTINNSGILVVSSVGEYTFGSDFINDGELRVTGNSTVTLNGIQSSRGQASYVVDAGSTLRMANLGKATESMTVSGITNHGDLELINSYITVSGDVVDSANGTITLTDKSALTLNGANTVLNGIFDLGKDTTLNVNGTVRINHLITAGTINVGNGSNNAHLTLWEVNAGGKDSASQMNIAKGATLEFDPYEYFQTIGGHVLVGIGGTLTYDPLWTGFANAVKYDIDWTYVSDTREISDITVTGKYWVLEGGQLTVLGCADDSEFKVSAGGALIFKYAGTINGDVTVEGGTVSIDAATQFGGTFSNSGDVAVNVEGVKFTSFVNMADGTLSLNAVVKGSVLNQVGGTIIAAAENMVLGSEISNAGNLLVQADGITLGNMKNSGTITVTGKNTVVNGLVNSVTDEQGTVVKGAISVEASGSLTVETDIADGMLAVRQGGSVTVSGNLSGLAVDIDNAGTITAEGALTFNGAVVGNNGLFDGTSFTFLGETSGTASFNAADVIFGSTTAEQQIFSGQYRNLTLAGLEKEIAADITVNGLFNNESGVQVAAGVLTLNQLAGAGSYTVGGQGTVIFGSAGSTVAGSVTNSGTVEVNALVSFGGGLSNLATGTLNLNAKGLNVTADNAGVINVNAQNVTLSGSNSKTVNVADGGSLTLKMTDAAGANYTVAADGVLNLDMDSASGTLFGHVDNAGTFNVISVVNSFDGRVSNSGTMVVESASNLANVTNSNLLILNGAAKLNGTVNDGTIQLNNGGVSVEGLTNNGILDITVGYTFDASEFTNDGLVKVSNGATVTAENIGANDSGDYSVEVGSTLNAGTDARFTGVLENNGTVFGNGNRITISGSTVGAGRVENSGEVVYDGTDAQDIFSGEYGRLTVTGDGTKTLNGDITINTNGNISSSFVNNGAITSDGVLIFDGKTSGNGTVNSTAETIYNQAAEHVYSGEYGKLTLSGVAKSIAGEVTANLLNNNARKLTVKTSGVLKTGKLADDVNSLYNILGTWNFTGDAEILGSVNNSGVISTDSDLTFTGMTTGSGRIEISKPTGTVKYSGNADHEIYSGNYNDLTIDGTGNNTLSGDVKVNGTMSLDTRLNASGSLTLSGDTTGEGQLHSTGSVIYDRNGDQDIYNGSYKDITIDGNGVKSIVGNVTISGNAVQSGGAVLHASNGNVTYNGNGTQQVMNGTYDDLTLNGTGQKLFAAGSLTTVNGTFTATGSPSQLLYLDSTIPGRQWDVAAGNLNFNWVHISNSNLLSGGADLNGNNSLGSGNTGWKVFDSAGGIGDSFPSQNNLNFSSLAMLLGNELRAAELEELFYEEGFVFRRSGSLPKLDPNGDDIAAVLQSEVDFLGLETAYDTAIFDGADFTDADYSDLMSRADIFKDEVDEALSEMVAI